MVAVVGAVPGVKEDTYCRQGISDTELCLTRRIRGEVSGSGS